MASVLLDYARNGGEGADRLITMAAAGGGLDAMRDLLTLLVGDPAHPEQRQLNDLSFEETVRVEILARFCAIRGNGLDVRRLAAVLGHMAETATRADDRQAFATESAKLLRSLADGGDGVASEYLATVVAEFPEVRSVIIAADLAPPPISRTNVIPPVIETVFEPSLGDILAECFAAQEPRGFFGRMRDYFTDLRWRLAR